MRLIVDTVPHLLSFSTFILAGISADPHAAQLNCPPDADMDTRVTSLHLPGLGEILCVAVASNGKRLVCTDSALYSLSASGLPTLVAGHSTELGFKDGQGSAARFNGLFGIAVDGTDIVFVCDSYNHSLRKVARNGVVSTLAGNQTRGYVDGIGDGTCFNHPRGIVVHANGTIFVTDSENNCVRQVAVDGAVSTLAGNGKKQKGFADGQGSRARFHTPSGLALDMDGHLIVADSNNHCIRRVTIAEGRVTTVAGSHEHGGRVSVDGEGAGARFSIPTGITVDGNNNIIVAEFANHHIRMIAGAAARVTTVVGSAQSGLVHAMGTSMGTCIGTSICLHKPRALALNECGHLLVADYNPGCLWVVEASLAPPHQVLGRVLLLQISARSSRTQSCACSSRTQSCACSR